MSNHIDRVALPRIAGSAEEDEKVNFLTEVHAGSSCRASRRKWSAEEGRDDRSTQKERRKEMKMKENLTFKTAAISAILLAIFAMPLVGVKGEPSTPVSGTWIPLPPLEFTNWKFVGGNIQCDAPSMNGKFTDGPITGYFIQSLHICYHYGDPKLVKQLKSQPPSAWPDTSFSFTHFVRVVGTEKDPAIVLGRSGTFEMRLEWHGYGNSFKGWAGFDIEGTWVIIHGTGGLAGLHGQGTVKHTRDGPLCFEYEGQVHFDP